MIYLYEGFIVDEFRGLSRLTKETDVPMKFLMTALSELFMYCEFWEPIRNQNQIYFSAIPCVEADPAKFCLVVKQKNNGSTFIASEYPLHHLDEYFLNEKKLIETPFHNQFPKFIHDLMDSLLGEFDNYLYDNEIH